MWTILVIISGAVTIVASDNDKRLLVNDMDVMSSRLTQLENTVKHLTTLITNTVQQEAIGSTYIHWGRNDCTAQNTELVYKGWAGLNFLGLLGYAAGGASNETGASPDFVCLPSDPKLKPNKGYDYGRIYGTEYRTDFWGGTEYGNDVPCAVCRSKLTSASIMIPGRDACYVGWKTEYHGFLGSSHHTHASGSAFICIDSSHVDIPGGGARDGGKMLVDVVAKCGSLQCPPYIDGYAFTCVVCSK